MDGDVDMQAGVDDDDHHHQCVLQHSKEICTVKGKLKIILAVYGKTQKDQ